MFMLKQHRKDIKSKLIVLVDKLGHQMWTDFDQFKVIKKNRSENNLVESQGSVSDKRENYEHEIEMNIAFESLQELGI